MPGLATGPHVGDRVFDLVAIPRYIDILNAHRVSIAEGIDVVPVK
jgi:hypothetical protein